MSNSNKKTSDRVSLVGLSAVGKSATAPLLAKALSFEPISLDYLVEQKLGRSISEIFKTHGENYFRQLESAALAQALTHPRAVLDLGAGIVTVGENRELIRANSFVVWLRAPYEVLIARLEAATERPLLSGANWKDVLAEMARSRELLYRRIADLELDSSAATPQHLANLIADEIKSRKN